MDSNVIGNTFRYNAHGVVLRSPLRVTVSGNTFIDDTIWMNNSSNGVYVGNTFLSSVSSPFLGVIDESDTIADNTTYESP
jgi:parallel beta-helix repeat protein